MPNLVQIPVSFEYETIIYVSSSSSSFVAVQESMTLPAANVQITVTDRSTGNPALVYTSSAGTSTYTSITTDAAGNVPGWVAQGSYTITAASAGAFGGATVNWEAIPGNAVANLAPNTVGAAQIQSRAISGSHISTTAGITGGQLANATVEGSNIDPTTPLTVGSLTSTHKASLGNLHGGTASITLPSASPPNYGASSGRINHNCVNSAGTPVVPVSIQVTLHMTMGTIKMVNGQGRLAWGVDYTTAPTTTQFGIYIISNYDISGQTFQFDWLAFS